MSEEKLSPQVLAVKRYLDDLSEKLIEVAHVGRLNTALFCRSKKLWKY